MDGTALFAAIYGVAYGVIATYLVVKRQWWKAIGSSAISGALLLNIVTQGNQSHLEHTVVFGVSVILIACFIACFAIVANADARTRRRTLQAKDQCQASLDGVLARVGRPIQQ